MGGNRWEQLFEGFSQRREAQASRRELTRELVTWYDEQTQLIMTLVREVASERAAVFQGDSGLAVDVQWPSHPPINIGPDGPFMSFMCVRIPGREVHLYSHRIGTGAPLIHFVVVGSERPDKQQKRLLGRPGCRIEQREGGGFLLRGVGDAMRHGEVSVDDLVYRAFELLLGES